MATVLANVQGARSIAGVSTNTIANSWLDNATFNQPGNSGPRRFPDVRLDWNVTKNNQISADFVAATVAALRKSQKCPLVYLTGTVGGLMTSLKVEIKAPNGELLKDGTFEKTERYGHLIGQVAERTRVPVARVRGDPARLRKNVIVEGVTGMKETQVARGRPTLPRRERLSAHILCGHADVDISLSHDLLVREDPLPWLSDPPLALFHSTTTVPLKRVGLMRRRTMIRVV